MSHNYHIAGTEFFGYSTDRRFMYSFYEFMNTVQRVCALDNNASVLNMRGYVAHFCYRKLKEFDTLYKVVVEHKDFVSANCILRMLGDSVAVFNLVYMEPNEELRWLRHALYVIDGCEQNLKVLPDDDSCRDSMPDAEYIEFKKGILLNIELRERLKAESQQILDDSPLSAKDKEAFDKIVKDRNWKFKTFKHYKHISDNRYSWAEMYEKIGPEEECKSLSFLSQYVHGLSMSNLVMEMNQVNHDAILAEALALIKNLNNCLMNGFYSEIRYIMEGFYVPKMRDLILACYDDVHRPTIEQWNEKVCCSIDRLFEK